MATRSKLAVILHADVVGSTALVQKDERLAHDLSQSIPHRLPFDYNDLGDQDVKGFAEPVRAYGVALREGEKIPAPEPESSELSAEGSIASRRKSL